MKKTTLFTLVSGMALALMLVGCAKPPQQELEAAQAALTAAVDAEADIYSTDYYLAAQDSFETAQMEIEAQGAKSSFSRNYDHAKTLLQYATQTAQTATEEVADRKEEVRVEADRLITEAQDAVMTAQDLLGKAPSGKEGAIALVSIQDGINGASTSLDSALTAQAMGKYAQARDLAQSAFNQASGLVNEMNQAIAKTQPPRS